MGRRISERLMGFCPEARETGAGLDREWALLMAAGRSARRGFALSVAVRRYEELSERALAVSNGCEAAVAILRSFEMNRAGTAPGNGVEVEVQWEK